MQSDRDETTEQLIVNTDRLRCLRISWNEKRKKKTHYRIGRCEAILYYFGLIAYRWLSRGYCNARLSYYPNRYFFFFSSWNWKQKFEQNFCKPLEVKNIFSMWIMNYAFLFQKIFFYLQRHTLLFMVRMCHAV